MIKKHTFLFINLTLFIFVMINISFINNNISDNISEYSLMLASKITKYVVNNAYTTKEFDMNKYKLYEIIKNNDGEIKTIIYDTMKVNSLLRAINDKIFELFDDLETGNLSRLNIRENILTNSDSPYEKGIILEVPSGIITNNVLFSSLGPKIPIKIALTGEFESCISTKVEEYGLNNALISIYVDIRITEQITMPFSSLKVVIENEIPIAMSLINGKIPDYYLNGFDKTSNLYKTG